MKVIYAFFLIVFSCFFCSGVFAQQKDISLANEYYQNGEYEKAHSKFQDLSSKTQNIPYIYSNYLGTLRQLKKKDELQKFVRKSIKAFPDNILYQTDLYLFMKSENDPKAEKQFRSIVSSIKNDPQQVDLLYEYLLKNGETEKGIDLLMEARSASGRKYEYAIQLSKAYMMLNNKEGMIDEMINYLRENRFQLEIVKNNFQNYLKDKEDFKILEDKLYVMIQKDPEDMMLNELLLWINIQNKNFRYAYMQAKAIDKKGNLNGNKLLEVGRIAMDNKDYDAASKFFQTITTEYRSSPNYSFARRLLIYSKEESVKNTYPVDREKIMSLIQDYKKMINELGRSAQSYEATRSMAVLYGLYLDQKDSAIALLKSVINEPSADHKLKALSKISLADIYLLNEEPWEASLLYSQVEKDMKEDQLGHEAKLKNAKVAYYKGEFELAQAHLDILKLATTREIANDAMDLSILIQDNSGLDTSYAALTEYADIDLLLFQNKDDEALLRLDSMLLAFPGHSLTDEIYWLKSKIFKRRGEYDKAINVLDRLLTEHSQGIFGDDALFTKASILEDNLSDKEAAMDLYREFLSKYPGSIYAAEARKRFRTLRGDKL